MLKYFFSDLNSIYYLNAWIIFIAVFSPGLIFSPFLSILQGFGKVKEVQTLIFIQVFFSIIGFWVGLINDFNIYTSNEIVNGLLKSDGMFGMLDTIWLIITAMIFGGVMDKAGFLKTIASKILTKVSTTGSLVSSTAGTCIFFNLTASDQYMSIVVPGRMFSKIYRDKNLAPENLSRTLEDSGTVTSVLVPWNTCGAYHASVLNVATLSYLPYCFFSLISPIMTILYAYLKLKIKKIN